MPTVGKQTGQAGNSVPLEGESEGRQLSSGVDYQTITLNSGSTTAAAGRGLVIRDYNLAGTTSSPGTEVFSAGYGGVSVGRVLVEDAATATAAETGGWGSTTLALGASQAGRILVVPTCSAAGGVITLPKASGVPLGTKFSFYFSTTANASAIAISSSLSSSDDCVVGVSTGKVIQAGGATGLQNHAYIDVVKIGAKRWLGLPGYSSAIVFVSTSAK